MAAELRDTNTSNGAGFNAVFKKRGNKNFLEIARKLIKIQNT